MIITLLRNSAKRCVNELNDRERFGPAISVNGRVRFSHWHA